MLLSQAGADYIRKQAEHDPLIGDALVRLRSKSDQALDRGIEVPLPMDPGGGYTHEQHKSNYQDALNTGTRFLIDGQEDARDHCKALLLAYAELYPKLPLHPQRKELAPGKLFWQVLNEEVALVHFIQAYDAIAGSISESERQAIVKGLIHPMVHFIKEDSKNTFNKIHNHGMWAVAGVGMCGLVLNEQEWVEQALYGTDKTGDGGFFKQIETLFSPDGYYSEGPYYQRYALMPLVLFAQALEKQQPEKGVFAYRDGLIIKAISTTVQLSSCDGNFFPLNDAIKSKTIETPELGYALPVWYTFGDQDPRLISLMETNGNLMLTDALRGISIKDAQPFERASVILSDGPNGNMGGLAVLRSDDPCAGITAVLKYGTHGMGHGHFDQLGLLVYDRGSEILSDYGATRYLNIPQKEGGRYLPENNSWSKQTIAHNTLTINGSSQHGGIAKTADQYSPYQVFAQTDEQVQAVCAADTTAYPGVELQRTVALVNSPNQTAFILDLFRVKSSEKNQYDLPFHFQGQCIASQTASTKAVKQLAPLGDQNGYEHLWLNSMSDEYTTSAFTLLQNGCFYTITTASDRPFQTVRTMLGANDPNQNLRPESAFIQRSQGTNQTWVNVIEAHGSYNTIHEKTVQAYSEIVALEFKETTSKVLEIDIDFQDNSSCHILADLRPTNGSQQPNLSITFKSE